MASFIRLVRNVIVFFYDYVYEGFYENNVDRRFNYISGYGTMVPRDLVVLCFISRMSLVPLSKWSTRDNTVGLLRLKIMRRGEGERYKRLGYLVT